MNTSRLTKVPEIIDGRRIVNAQDINPMYVLEDVPKHILECADGGRDTIQKAIPSPPEGAAFLIRQDYEQRDKFNVILLKANESIEHAGGSRTVVKAGEKYMYFQPPKNGAPSTQAHTHGFSSSAAPRSSSGRTSTITSRYTITAKGTVQQAESKKYTVTPGSSPSPRIVLGVPEPVLRSNQHETLLSLPEPHQSLRIVVKVLLVGLQLQSKRIGPRVLQKALELLISLGSQRKNLR
ncbi:hypothetical protein HYALB_00012194 [Hymenoscyphus albidus]|uniref:Uncharacterized protein n=1 Tax=Hymenoscyphus albidus TaxID=595503 RepID=A0A9N9LM17_9HELO|nr:hypothetical protein HYALB_00012194 [Hymenoscyphus albidus]